MPSYYIFFGTSSVGGKGLPFTISFAKLVLNLLVQLCFRWKAAGVKETRTGKTVDFYYLECCLNGVLARKC